MCGGTIEFEPGATVGVCDSCGTKQTLPKLDDDRRTNLYDRANHFRRNNEFDKAAGLYEQILNEDTTDAEAYWSLVLCRYGIEYVEDPKTHRRVPTVNRAQFTSIFDGDNYRSAIQYADGYQRVLYEEEAAAINEIQKGILEISQKEEPFDVFICYKETDAAGRRTQDSVLANDLYHQLTREGFKVFFSRITLEDKLGTAYEPYIFAALNSAKVMVVLGTRPEHFNAVWVKNEWSRYLALVRQSGGKKVLIPAYRDMDPYDLPEEFSHLQAQDMSRLGFMQDLIRGIKKITQSDGPRPEKKTSSGGGSANTEALLKRAYMFLEDGDFKEADRYCERVLDQDPENARAYLGKLMAELQVRNQEDLADCEQPFDDRNNYKKAVRFADEKLARELEGYVVHINERNENARLQEIYDGAVYRMQNAINEGTYRVAADIFETIPGFLDADELAQTCFENAEECRKRDIYAYANSIYEQSNSTIENLESAIKEFQSISGYKDSEEMIVRCEQRIADIRARAEAERLEWERKAEAERTAIEKKRKRRKKITIASVISVTICVVIAVVVVTVVIPNKNYNNAVTLMERGDYEAAIVAFEAVNGYKDSNELVEESKYRKADALLKSGDYGEAVSEFEALGSYKDSQEKATEAQKAKYYSEGLSYFEQRQYSDAIFSFKKASGYRDADSKIEETQIKLKEQERRKKEQEEEEKKRIKYNQAIDYLNSDNIQKSLEYFREVSDYKDSSQYIDNIFIVPISISSSTGNKYEFNYDEKSGRIDEVIQISDYPDKFSGLKYDNLGRIISYTKDEGSTFGKDTYVFEYDNDGNASVVSTGEGNYHTSEGHYTFDKYGNITNYDHTSWHKNGAIITGSIKYNNKIDKYGNLLEVNYKDNGRNISITYENTYLPDYKDLLEKRTGYGVRSLEISYKYVYYPNCKIDSIEILRNIKRMRLVF